MRKLLSTFLVISSLNVSASNYFFSSTSGDDSRSTSEAQNEQTPWKSLAKLNAIMNILLPGDIISFKRGDEFEGTIVINKSGTTNNPITFTAFGTGDKPVVSGLMRVVNWTATGSAIYESSSSSFNSTINTLLVNGVPQRIGRYPNVTAPTKGYLTIVGTNGSNQITDDWLNSTNWSGGDIVIRKAHWVIDRNFITSQSGNTINYNSETPNATLARYGYFIENHPNTLDLEGEWCFNSSIKKLSIYSGLNNPVSSDIEVSTINTLVFLNNQNNIVFENLSFKGANINAFEINNSQQIRISNCDVLFSGANAFKGTNSRDLKIEKSFIYYSNNNAFDLANMDNITIANNKISCTGVFAGMGIGGSGSYDAVLVDGNNHTIEFNEIDSTGYNPISFRGSFNTIRNNFINNFNITKDDGGGIYTWNNIAGAPVNTGSKVVSNIILNGIGAGEGTPEAGDKAANGIYLDDNTANVEVTGNTVAFCGLNGIYLHNAHEILIGNNTVFNSSNQIVMSEDDFAPNSPIRNISMNDNIFISKETYQPVAKYFTEKNDLNSFGSFDRNNYSRPTFDHLVIEASYKINGTYFNKALDLQDWKTLYAKDASSTKSPVNLPSGDSFRFEYNATASPKSIFLNDTYIDVNSLSYSGTITLQPFTSIVLLKKANDVPLSSCLGSGSIFLEVWENAFGNTIADIPLNQNPGRTIQLPSIEFNSIGDNYGSRMRGFICPPQTGNYIFYIAGDDAAELWLSTDDNPANKIRIASLATYTGFREWDRFPTQKSRAITLNAGTKYYIEVLQKEALGGDHVSVAWQLPDGTMDAPIKGNYVVPFVNTTTLANQTISFPAISVKGVNDPPFLINATASSGLPVSLVIVSGPATLLNKTLTITGVGTVIIEASQAGNSEYNPAPVVRQSFDVVVTPPPVVCSATGVISYEFWSNIPGNNIWNFSYLATPTVTSNISMFEGPTDTSDNYASRIRGYLCPPADGNYTFWIAGDDATELWLSSDDDPSNKAKIAYSLSWTYPREWNKFSTQKSQPVTLATGKKYYIEALHKEGGGGDNLAVAWQLPDGFIEGPIPGSRLSPYGAVTALNQTIDFNALPDVTFSTSPLIISAVASSGLPVSFTVVSGPATVTGNIVTLKGVGEVTIAASQAGNNVYTAAPVVIRSFAVLPATDNTPPTIITKDLAVNANVNGQATIKPFDVIQSITDDSGVDSASVALSQTEFACAVTNNSNLLMHQAYIATTIMGNQNFGGELGMEFKVNAVNGITINQLGAFDHEGNGIIGTQGGGVRVAIFNKATKSIIPGLDAIVVGNADSYISNHRMKNIPAVTLMPGDYVVVAKGYNMNELNGNSYGGTPFISGDIGGGAITYTGVGLYGSEDAGFAYPLNPDSGPANRYLAGTFTYLTAMEADKATHQAYIATTTMGNQNFGGELGMEFKVNAVNGITISQLGAFDHEGNGIIGTQSGGVRVAIFNKATKSIIPGLDAIIVGNADSYISNHRMKNIPAVTLMPGDYVVVAKGYNMNELNGNSYGGTPFISGDMGGGAITYTGVGLYGSEDAGFAYPLNPDSGPANRYLAGTFTYSIISSNTSTNNVVSVTAKDIHGNTAYATATVTLICEPTSKTNAQTSTDPQSEKRSLQVASSGTILVDKEENTLKVFPNPTAGQFSVQIPPLKVDQAVMQVLNESGKIISQRVVKRFNSTDITSKVDFDLTKQASGVYVVKLISAVGVLVSKEIILR